MNTTSPGSVRVSVIVKALNEEQRIAACLEAALMALEGLDAELILVDSISADRTVEIASRYPVRIVRFDHIQHRSCGAAVELGWRFSRGEFVYVLDADMLLQPGFLQLALAYLEVHPRVAGVGGKLIDTRLNTVADQQRMRRAAVIVGPCEVDELGGGGLYRRVAIEQAGYLAHRSLAAYEEAELGVRLRALGWSLIRLPQTAVLHEGHVETNRQMLRRLWANGRAMSAATFLQSALGRPWFGLVLHKLKHIVAVPLMHGVAMLLALAGGWRGGPVAAMAAWAGFWAAACIAMAIGKRSARVAVWHLLLWHYWAAGTVAGWGRHAADPMTQIPAHEINSATSKMGVSNAATTRAQA